MPSRYELREAQWERIKNTLPGRVEQVGRTAADFREAIALLGSRETEAVIADKGYDSAASVDHIHSLRARAVIPARSRRKYQRCYDRGLYRQRHASKAASAA